MAKEEDYFVIADLKPIDKDTTLQDITNRAGKLAADLAQEYRPAAALAIIKVAEKTLVSMIELNLNEVDAEKVKRHAEVIEETVKISLHAIEGDG